ncbi:MAG: radical SAM protein, partial [Anaerolineales bacterium]|nr:radical SAM protein [Anaerolineales bacterium]
EIAVSRGLHLPLVYNSGGYDSVETLKLLDGIIDIYMPDMKYANTRTALHYSKIRNYPQINQAAVKEMHRQVGDLNINQEGLATRGLLIRHLVLPNNLAGTEQIVKFLADEISPNTYVNLMDQYRPAFKANQYPKLKRQITPTEYQHAVHLANEAGLQRLDSRRAQFLLG